jgi:hypothetical protein
MSLANATTNEVAARWPARTYSDDRRDGGRQVEKITWTHDLVAAIRLRRALSECFDLGGRPDERPEQRIDECREASRGC